MMLMMTMLMNDVDDDNTMNDVDDDNANE